MTTNSTTNVASNQQLEPPKIYKVRWCPMCGRDDRVQQLKVVHYRGGEICRGVPVEIEYSRVSAGGVVATVDQIRELLDRFLWDKYGCTIEHHRMKVLKHFVEWAATASPDAPKEEAEAERMRVIAYLSHDTVYQDDFCIRCSHELPNCECAAPVYMAGFEPNEKLKALKVALFQEARPRKVFDAGFTTPSPDAAREAAKEINDLAIAELGHQFYGPVYTKLTEIIERHCLPPRNP